MAVDRELKQQLLMLCCVCMCAYGGDGVQELLCTDSKLTSGMGTGHNKCKNTINKNNDKQNGS